MLFLGRLTFFFFALIVLAGVVAMVTGHTIALDINIIEKHPTTTSVEYDV